jgi:hypothetical protein
VPLEPQVMSPCQEEKRSHTLTAVKGKIPFGAGDECRFPATGNDTDGENSGSKLAYRRADEGALFEGPEGCDSDA